MLTFLFLSYQYILQLCDFLKYKVSSRFSALPDRLKIQLEDTDQAGTAAAFKALRY